MKYGERKEKTYLTQKKRVPRGTLEISSKRDQAAMLIRIAVLPAMVIALKAVLVPSPN